MTPAFADAAGVTIAGSANYASAIHVTSSDPHVTITSPAGGLLTAPGQAITFSYDGNAAASSTVTIGYTSSSTIASSAVGVPGLAVTRYDLGSPGTTNPGQLVQGNDHKIWWTEFGTNQIGRIDPAVGASSITHFPSGFASGRPIGITAGGDGNIWYSNGGQVIARMTTSGAAPASGPAQITVSGVGGQVRALATDAAGNVWYVNAAAGFSQVAYVDFLTFSTHTFGSTPTADAIGSGSALTLGQDNAMWFTEPFTTPLSHIGRITTPLNGTAGIYSEYNLSATNGTTIFPFDIAEGPDGKIWLPVFASNAANQFYASFVPGAVKSGTVSLYPNLIDPNAFANLVTIVAGADGNMWIAEGGGAVKISPASPTTPITQFFTDNGQTTMVKCMSGPDLNLWCTAIGSAALGPGFINTNDGIIT
jgi:streptogramin lyase